MAIGRLTQVASGGTNYISNVTYNAAHAPTAYSYGNGVAAAIGYNSRFQLASLAYTKSSTKLLELAYGYTGQSNGGNNGQITGITDSIGTQEAGRSVTYTYDAWARLKTAATTGSSTYPAWGLSWSYDRYGNRKQQSVTAGSGPSSSLNISTTNNRITDTGYSYDLAGNMTADGLNTLAYDGESRVGTSTTNSVTTTNTYDGNSLRVKKQVGGTATIYIFSGSKVIAEYAAGAGTGSPTREYIYGGSALVATIDSSSTKYHHADHLSARVTTDNSGNLSSQQGHYPFGEAWYAKDASGATVTPNKWLFTSYERDQGANESGNDYAMFRTHISRLGRFNRPDPIAGCVGNPQSLNLYAYVRNDPINFRDPLGLNCTTPDGRVVPCPDVTSTTVNTGVTPIDTTGVPIDGRLVRSGSLNGGGSASDLFEWVESTDSPGDAGGAQESGGPYHPPGDTPTKCTNKDSCSELSLKMNYLKHMIASHVAWDKEHNTNRHSNDIAERRRNLGTCVEIHQRKCTNRQDPPRGAPVLVEQPEASRERVRTVTRTLAAGIAAAGTGYAIYRIVRFLPSLAPPLWWTIPINATAP